MKAHFDGLFTDTGVPTYPPKTSEHEDTDNNFSEGVPVTITTLPVKFGIWSVENLDAGGHPWAVAWP